MQKKYLVLQIAPKSAKEVTQKIILTNNNKNIYDTLTDIFFYEDIFIYSKNEYFIDITNYQEFYKKSPYIIALDIKEKLGNKHHVKVKIGIGTNLFLAKIACDIVTAEKKIKIAYLDEKEYILTCSKYEPLSNFFQISNSMMLKLRTLKINNMEDIRNYSYKKLYEEFGQNAETLINHSLGIENTTIKELNKTNLPTTLSACTKFQTLKTRKETAKQLLELLDFNILKLKEKSLNTKSIHLYIKYANNIIPKTTIPILLEEETNSYSTIINSVLKAYHNQSNLFIPIEKIAISFGKLTPKIENTTIFTSSKKKINHNFTPSTNEKTKLSFLIRKKITFLRT